MPAGTTSPAWLYHHLTIVGASATASEFAEAARGPGVVPWQLDYAAIEEDIFNLAASQPPHRRTLTIEGCRILARRFRQRVEARQHRAAALVGRSRAGAASQARPFDLHTLLPIPVALLQRGPSHPEALAWLRENWGITDRPRHVAERPAPIRGAATACGPRRPRLRLLHWRGHPGGCDPAAGSPLARAAVRADATAGRLRWTARSSSD